MITIFIVVWEIMGTVNMFPYRDKIDAIVFAKLQDATVYKVTVSTGNETSLFSYQKLNIDKYVAEK